MPPIPLLLSPALPSELLTYVLNHHVYPSTVIIGSTRQDFLKSLQEPPLELDTSNKTHDQEGSSSQPLTERPRDPVELALETRHESEQDLLLSQTISYLAISRHIRTVYIPTVTHLRSYLSVFSPEDSKTNAPPPVFTPPGRNPPTLVLYGVINLHRDTSEWSAQGLGNTAAALVETASRLGWDLVMIEPHQRHVMGRNDGSDEEDDERRREEAAGGSNQSKEDSALMDLLKEKIPVLSGSVRRAGLDSDEGGWSGRSVEIGRAMSRWFRFRHRPQHGNG